MSNIEFGEIIAERLLELQDESGIEHEVIVRIGKPIPDPNPGGDWCCPFQIMGLNDDQTRAVFGVDQVQALLLSFEMIRTQLNYYQTNQKYELTWLGQNNLGFPAIPNFQFDQSL